MAIIRKSSLSSISGALSGHDMKECIMVDDDRDVFAPKSQIPESPCNMLGVVGIVLLFVLR